MPLSRRDIEVKEALLRLLKGPPGGIGDTSSRDNDVVRRFLHDSLADKFASDFFGDDFLRSCLQRAAELNILGSGDKGVVGRFFKIVISQAPEELRCRGLLLSQQDEEVEGYDGDQATNQAPKRGIEQFHHALISRRKAELYDLLDKLRKRGDGPTH
jgi:hypothetical protein